MTKRLALGQEFSASSRSEWTPRPLRILFLNHHIGTLSELTAVTLAISRRHNVLITIHETFGISTLGQPITRALADAYWPVALHQECNRQLYDFIIVGDTLPLLRPHLQNGCPLPMLAMLTTRFDWDLQWDNEFHALIEESSLRPNFRLIPNNLFEKHYADLKGLHIAMEPYTPSSGIPTKLWYHALSTSNKVLRQHNDEELIIPISVYTEECLLPHLDSLSIPYSSSPRNQHGGPLALSDALVVHIPYQSNVMSLFENLRQRVIYLIPSLSLYYRLGKTCGAQISNTDPNTFTEEEYRTYIDWWRPAHSHLFYYFDEFEDLRLGSALRTKIIREAEEKRGEIAAFMGRQAVNVLERWEEVLFAPTNSLGDDKIAVK
ncbi:MAG: hypothetical protein CYPHOPRED_002740 [Cyphobasidiales sp. Tagirdzhanova-0007]|nr:MAG: hypothetical protein CYPHOPRED_002740 [Cyphobasidiales sp. Tagirdzhanova-0007]